jgi:hypothetical protein
VVTHVKFLFKVQENIDCDFDIIQIAANWLKTIAESILVFVCHVGEFKVVYLMDLDYSSSTLQNVLTSALGLKLLHNKWSPQHVPF